MDDVDVFSRRFGTLIHSISDAHSRMATNRDAEYRRAQRKKIDGWLEELTQMHEEHPGAWDSYVRNRTNGTEASHPCPRCGAPGIQVCLGCDQPIMARDCGCPCGTAYRCSRSCKDTAGGNNATR